MSNIMERIQQETAERAAQREKIEIARQFLAEGISPEVVSRCTGLSQEEVMELAGEKSA